MTNGFSQKVWTVTGIVALAGTILLVLGKAFNVLLLILAAVLIAILFRGTAAYLVRKTGMKNWLAMTITLGGTAIILVGMFWFIGARLQSQAAQLSDQLPQQVEKAREELSKSPVGKQIADRISQRGGAKNTKLLQRVRGFVSSTFGALGDAYVVLLLAMFFMAAPMLYVNGAVRLVPPRGRAKAREVMEKTGADLYKWFVGKIFAMAVVGILTWIGLTVLGIPLTVALAVIAGLLNFIPNFGPIIAMVPAVLIALTKGADSALYVAILYIVVQVVESNLITPTIQSKLVQIPPVLIIVAQLIVGLFSGGIGLIIATPVMVIAMRLVQELYLKPAEQRVPVSHGNPNDGGDG